MCEVSLPCNQQEIKIISHIQKNVCKNVGAMYTCETNTNTSCNITTSTRQTIITATVTITATIAITITIINRDAIMRLLVGWTTLNLLILSGAVAGH
jgi:hypothetical protein